MDDGYIDCHCHLAAKDFEKDISDVVSRAKEAGVRGLILVTEHAGEFDRALELSETFPDIIVPCLGVHPVQTLPSGKERSVIVNDFEGVTQSIERVKDRLVAIGEIGLDFTPRFIKTDEDKKTQRRIFAEQIQLAKKLDLPVNVHSRSAGKPTIDLLKEQGAERVLLHAFDGRPAVAMEGVKQGYFFSIPPSIVRSEQQKLVKRLPLENICLETDSPALAAEKQTRNEPMNIHLSCEYIAKIKGVSPETVKRSTTENALKLFPNLRIILKR